MFCAKIFMTNHVSAKLTANEPKMMAHCRHQKGLGRGGGHLKGGCIDKWPCLVS